jgi:hypothetical protein
MVLSVPIRAIRGYISERSDHAGRHRVRVLGQRQTGDS